MNATQLIPVARTLLRAHDARGVRPDELAGALAHGTPRAYADGDILCAENTSADSLFVLLRGNVRVTRKDSNGQARELAIIPAPALIGHMGLVDGSPRSATCTAQGNVGVMSMDASVFRDVLSQTGENGSAMRHLILASLIQQLSTANEKVRDLIGQIAEEEKPRAAAPKKQPKSRRQIQEEDVLKLAGVLDGWSVDSSDVNRKVRFVEDDDARRTREARKVRR